MARATGLEPATSGVTGRHSNQLSYARAGGPLRLRVATGAGDSTLPAPVKENGRPRRRSVHDASSSRSAEAQRMTIAVPDRKLALPPWHQRQRLDDLDAARPAAFLKARHVRPDIHIERRRANF